MEDSDIPFAHELQAVRETPHLQLFIIACRGDMDTVRIDRYATYGA